MTITLYYSSVPGSIKVRQETTRIEQILKAKKIEFEMVDVAVVEEAKINMQEKSKSNVIPQIFVDGEFKGFCEQLEEANEYGELEIFLGLK